MARLPIPGSDNGDWGDILNAFLEVSLYNNPSNSSDPDNGTLNSGIITDTNIASNAAIGLTKLNATGTPSSSNFLRGDGTWAVPNGGSSSLASDTDVSISGTPSNNQALIYDSTASKWTNQAITEADVTNLSTDLAATEKTANKGVASGYAPLNGSSQVPIANISTGTTSSTVAIGNDSRFAGSPGGTANASLSATDSSVTNSRTPTGTAGGDLTGSYPSPTLSNTTNVESIISANSTVASKAPIASPTFTGKVTTPALQVTTGSGTANQVLTSDVSGNATWASVSGANVSGVLQTTNDLSELTATASTARSNISAAKSGSNSDITNLTGLTTPLPANEGGTGATSSTGSGSVVLSTSPTLNTPILAGAAEVALTYSATISTNVALGNIFWVVLTGNATISNPTNPAAGQKLIYRLKQDATGSRTVTWGTLFRFGTDIPTPTLTTTASKNDYIGFIYNDIDGYWDCIALARGY